MKTLLICHEDAPLDRIAMPRWLGSFSTLTGVVVIREQGARKLQRRKNAEPNSCKDRHADGKQQHPQIHCDGHALR